MSPICARLSIRLSRRELTASCQGFNLALFGIDGQDRALTVWPTRSMSWGWLRRRVGADVADVDHPFDAFGDLNEGAEFGEAHDRAFDLAADRKFLRYVGPGIARGSARGRATVGAHRG